MIFMAIVLFCFLFWLIWLKRGDAREEPLISLIPRKMQINKRQHCSGEDTKFSFMKIKK